MRILGRTQRSARSGSPASSDLDAQLAVLGLGPGADEALIEIAYRCQVERPAEADHAPEKQRLRLDGAIAALRIAIDSDAIPHPRLVGKAASDPYELLRLHRSARQELITAAYAHALRSALAAQDSDRVTALEWAYSRIGTVEARAAHDRRRPPRHRSRLCLTPAGPRTPPDTAGRAGSTQSASPGSVGRLRDLLTRLRGRPVRAVAPSRDPAAGECEEGTVPIVARPVHALSITLGGQAVETVELQDGAAYIIGSAAYCDIPLVPPVQDGAATIAAEHARVAAGVGGVSFRQLAEHVQTLVNGRPARWTLLEPGDELRIGPYRCRYEISRFEVDRWRVAAWS